MRANQLFLIASLALLGLVFISPNALAAEPGKFTCSWSDEGEICRFKSGTTYQCEAGYTNNCLSIKTKSACENTQDNPKSCLYLADDFSCYWKDNNTCGGTSLNDKCTSGYEDKVCDGLREDACRIIQNVPCPGPRPDGGGGPDLGGGPDVTFGPGILIKNPLKFGTIPDILNAVAGFLYALALAVVTIMVLWGGLQILTAAGNPTQIEKGKKTLLYAVIGTVVILVAGGIADLVANILGADESINPIFWFK